MNGGVEFKKYIEKNGFRTKEDDNNYQFIPGRGEPGWKLNIPSEKQEEFLTNYYNMKVKNGLVSTLVEKPHPEYNQIRIDIDLKYRLSTNKERLDNTHQYKEETIKKLISKYIEITSEYIQIPAKGVNFTLFEKPKYRITGGIKEDKQIIKDGIHIICPDLVINNTVLHAIYDDIINDTACKKIVAEFGTEYEIGTIIDKSVISSGCWVMLGSGKVSDEPDAYYKKTKNFLVKYNGRVSMTEKDLKLNDLKSIIYYSNYNKKENTKLHNEININVLENRLKTTKSFTAKLTEVDKIELQNRNQTKNNYHKKVDIEYIKHLLSCLKHERVCNYQDWFNVGVCLYNISENLYTLYENWSKQWEHFNKDDVYREWYEKISNYGNKYSLSLTQLKRYAKEDNLERYLKIMNLEKQSCIDNLVTSISRQTNINGKITLKKSIGPLDISLFIKDYIELHCDWEVKCADITSGSSWYKFENGLWKEDKGAHKIHMLFSDEIVPTLKKTHKYLRMKFFENETNSIGRYTLDDDNQQKTADTLEAIQQVIQNKLATIKQIDEFFQKTTNRNNLVTDISKKCYDSEFYKQLNENRNVFCCNNCVLDLKSLEIRTGLPEDMSTIKTDIDFPLDIDTPEATKAYEVISDLLDKIYPHYDVQEYLMNIFAESLSGVQRRDKFHIHTGSGGNGKSVIFDLLGIVFGDYYDSPDANLYTFNLTNPNDVNPVTAGLKGRRMVVTGEQKADTPFNSANVKKLTGGDPISGRHLHKEVIKFKPQASFHAAMNDIPQMDGPVDGGIERRMEIFEYPARFLAPGDKKLLNPKKYPYCFPRDEKFRNEEYLRSIAPYFLRMLWDRYCNLQKNNFEQVKNEQYIPESVTKYTKAYMQTSNAIDQYITEKIEYKAGHKQKISEIFKDFKKYTSDTVAKSYNQNEFMRQFKRRINDGRIVKECRTNYSYDNVIIGQGEEYEE